MNINWFMQIFWRFLCANCPEPAGESASPGMKTGPGGSYHNINRNTARRSGDGMSKRQWEELLTYCPESCRRSCKKTGSSLCGICKIRGDDLEIISRMTNMTFCNICGEKLEDLGELTKGLALTIIIHIARARGRRYLAPFCFSGGSAGEAGR